MRFGVEIELDASDGRDFALKPLAPGEMPKGHDLVVKAISDLGLDIEAHGWKHNHNNSIWVCKPDSSCGMEVCSPVLDDGRIDEVLAVVDALDSIKELTSGPNCSLHVHVDVSSMLSGPPESSEELCSVLAWWVKCEPVMLDSVPGRRKNSRFCRCIGMTDLFGHEEKVIPCMTVSKLSEKYLTLNTHHMVARKRSSIEFRILEGTKDSSLVREWVNFVLNFVSRSREAGMPEDYRWVSRDEVCDLVESEESVRWLLKRTMENILDAPDGFWRSRAAFEAEFLSESSIFGRRDPCGIGAELDK